MTRPKILLTAVLVMAVGVHFLPVDRSNPPVTGEIVVPMDVRSILERSCYDCHSNETRWEWYHYLAPVSWIVARDVEEGRKHLNFSHWSTYTAGEKSKLMREMWEEVDSGEMPLSQYTLVHRDAVLDDSERETLERWSESRHDTLR